MAIFPIAPVPSTTSPVVFSGKPYPIPDNTTILQTLATEALNDNAILDVADVLDLSPTAQTQLAGFNGISSLIDNTNGVTTSLGFILTGQQQQQITSILVKYKDAPFNQDTFNNIQNDLKAAGLSPDQLALQDIGRFAVSDSTQMFLDALNGQNNNLDFLAVQNNFGEQANADAYMQQIFNQWKSMSTTAPA